MDKLLEEAIRKSICTWEGCNAHEATVQRVLAAVVKVINDSTSR